MKISIRKMRDKDAEKVMEIGNKTSELWESDEIKFPFSLERIQTWINDRNDLLLAIEVDNKFAGFSISSISYDTSCIEFFAIEENYRGKGLGKKLLEYTVDALKKKGVKRFYLGSLLTNQRGISFFQKCGFKSGYNYIFMYRGEW